MKVSKRFYLIVSLLMRGCTIPFFIMRNNATQRDIGRISLFVLCLIGTLFLHAADIPTKDKVGPHCMTDTIERINAPFAMPQLEKPQFPDHRLVVKMKKKGLSTENIQKAIDQLASLGGGRVVIPCGKWKTGRIILRSNINLEIQQGAELEFSGFIRDYLPAVFTRDEGIEIYSLGACIYAHDAENIAVTGKGRIIGPSIDCEIFRINKEKALNIENVVGDKPLKERIYDGLKSAEVFLPKTIAPINCKNVLIEEVTLDRGLYWNIVPQYCEDVIIRGVTVTSFGHGRTDGIDVESSCNVLIEYCSLDCSDDCYTIKSGRGKDGVKVGRPSENIVIRYCIANRGAGGIVCGTEIAGGIRNVYMHDCVFDGTDQAFRFKTLRPRGGGAENIYIERVRASVKGAAFYCNMLGSQKWGGELAMRFPARKINEFTPDFHAITISNVIIEDCSSLIDVNALPERPLANVRISRITATCKSLGKMRDVSSFIVKNAQIITADPVLTVDGCNGILLLGVKNMHSSRAIQINYEGERLDSVLIQDYPLTYQSIKPGRVWLDTNGNPIQAHGFQLFEKDGLYYWYGENKEYTTLGRNVWTYGIRCYRSRDFYNWEDCGLIIKPDTVNPLSPLHYSQTLDRPHIIYNEKTGKYVCWIKSMDTDGYFVILQADDLLGPYEYVRSLKPRGYGVGDFDMYVDSETGNGYVWFERPHWEMICARLSDDFLDITPDYSKHFIGLRPPFTREAPAHFMYEGKHYLFTSGTTGYVPNLSLVSSFDDYHGEYTDLGNPHPADKYQSSFFSQITDVIKIPGKDLYVALADRWLPQLTGTDIPIRTAKNKEKQYVGHKPFPRDFNQPKTKDKRKQTRTKWDTTVHATYVFLPIVFKDGVPQIEWLDEWRIEDYE